MEILRLLQAGFSDDPLMLFREVEKRLGAGDRRGVGKLEKRDLWCDGFEPFGQFSE